MLLSVLDQSTIVTGRSPGSSIQESLALARHAEALGYHRYWVAEHHNSDSQAGTAPEILIAAIAATTEHIRVGSAGVMLPHYSSLKVAEQFRVLESIAPGRIDLGVGRAPGSDGRTAYALNPNAADRRRPASPQQVARTPRLARRREASPSRHPFAATSRAQPAGPHRRPQVWVLGSSDYGAQVAAHFGLPYCYAHFIAGGQGAAEALDLYRETYRPSARHPTPYAALCVWALAADTDAEALRQYGSRALFRLGRDSGVYAPLPSPEDAAAVDLTDLQRAKMERDRARAMFGTGPEVARQLRALGTGLGVQEMAVLTTMHDPAARRRSYELLADAWGLSHARREPRAA